MNGCDVVGLVTCDEWVSMMEAGRQDGNVPKTTPPFQATKPAKRPIMVICGQICLRIWIGLQRAATPMLMMHSRRPVENPLATSSVVVWQAVLTNWLNEVKRLVYDISHGASPKPVLQLRRKVGQMDLTIRCFGE